MTKTRVLLADDHALVRTGIRNALQELSDLTIVGEVGDGPALDAALEAVQPDLLIVDLHMPDFAPLDALRRIQSRYPDLSIFVISAYDDDVYVQGVLGIGVDGYHLKDQPLSDLKLAVQRVLAGERWISSPLLDKLVQYTGACAVLPALTIRQRDLLRLLQQGLDNQSIAQRLGLSVKTVENHLTRLYRRLGVESRLEAANYAVQHPEILGLSGRQMAERSPLPRLPGSPPQFTLLLVDDSHRYRAQLRRMIGRAYPETVIHEADDVGEAVRLAESLRPSLALVDVILGDEDGIRCTRRLKALCPDTRVILMSAYPDREFHRLGLEAGAAAFLDKKDLDVATLRQMIEDLIE
ncbi:MAG TPA: response regulator transcription factor [Chloroflexi bacterium]|nr:response regulator transcription factor [Chloroflexota bacterium]